MDEILSKHLASAFLLPKKEGETLDNVFDTILRYHSCKKIDDNYYVKLENDTIISESLGNWNDKPILSYHDIKYVLLENSQTLIKLDTVNNSEVKIKKTDTKNKPKTFKPLKKEVSDKPELIVPISINSDTESEPQIKPPKLNILPVEVKDDKTSKYDSEDILKILKPLIGKEFKKTEPIEIKKQNIDPEPTEKEVALISIPLNTHSSTASYIVDKDEDSEEKSEVYKSNNSGFIEELQKHKDDPRVKNFFNYHTELAKKEIFSITEKFTQQQMARAMESGGGTNAVQYANGGTMNGNLLIDGDLQVSGNSSLNNFKITRLDGGYF